MQNNFRNLILNYSRIALIVFGISSAIFLYSVSGISNDSFWSNFGLITENSETIGSDKIESTDVLVGNATSRQLLGAVLGTKTSNTSKALLEPVSGCGINLDSSSSVSGGIVIYDMEIKNLGSQTCINPSLTVHYTDREVVQSTNPKSSSGNYYWRLTNLSAGGVTKVTIKTTFSGDELNTDACATADNGVDSCVLNTGTNSEPEPIIEVPSTPITPPVAEPVQNTSGVFIPKGEYGMWVWVSPQQMTDAYRTKLLNTASVNGINVLYVAIDDYLSIYNLPASTSRTNKLKAYDSALARLVDEARKKNISIDAEAGWKDWADPSKRANSYAIIDYVAAFNTGRVNQVRKVQFDVEPYLLSTYERNKASILGMYVEYVADIAKRSKNSNVQLSMVIPHFYDSLQKWTPAVTYNGQSNYTFNHILGILDQNVNSSIIIMAYRNFASGNNGSIQISQQEIRDASNGVRSTSIVVAQEMGQVEPNYVTFHGKTKNYMLTEFKKIDNQFKSSSGYNGIAIHYYEPFVEIIE